MKPSILILFLSVLTINAQDLEDLMHRADQLNAQEQFDQALEYIHEYISSGGKNIINAYFQRGCTYLKIGKLDEAVAEFDKIITHNPFTKPAYYNKAYVLKTAGRIDEAITIYQQLIDKDPDYESAQIGLSFGYISKGDFEHGWPAHEWYLKKYGKYAPELRTLLATNSIKGKTILLSPEGGLGDTIQFVRYAERLKNMGAHIIVFAQPQLMPLLNNCAYIDELYTLGNATPPHHARATLMSLPAIFYDNEDTIPQNIPYIFPDKDLVNYWKEQLASDTNFKIGICWQTSVHNDISRLPIARRGIPLEQFFKFKDITGISWYSLQQVEGLEQLTNVPTDFNLHVFPDDFDKKNGCFMDTAAVIANLDLVISVDTATAHLAGALGKPVWLLLPFSTDWRWIAGRTDTPWYPHTHIFKQPTPFDWDSVMNQIHQLLKNN
jgi:tetratricopeptide (TPR) repeat protein